MDEINNKIQAYEARFLDYLEGQMGDEERRAFEVALKENKELAQSLKAYQALVEIETELRAEQYAQEVPNLESEVMQQLSRDKISRSKSWLKNPWFFAPMVTCCVALLCVRWAALSGTKELAVEHTVQEFSSSGTESVRTTESGPQIAVPLAGDTERGERRPSGWKDPLSSSLPLAVGNRAVTIPIEEVAGIEGGVVPGSRIDIVATADATSKIIVQNAKILSLGDSDAKGAAAKGQRVATLEVDTTNALRLEAAKGSKLSMLPRSAGDVSAPMQSYSAITDSSVSAPSRSASGVFRMGQKSYTLQEGRLVALDDLDEYKTPQVENKKSYPSGSESYGRIRCATFGCDDRRYLPPPPVQTPSSEQYVDYAENDRVSVSQQPVSTFSLDVDTGSYSNVRRFINSRQLPPTAAVRVEEFVNYFNYNYPHQERDPFTVSYEVAPAPFDRGRHLLKLGVKTKDVQVREVPWNLVFLIDVSGSMQSDNKLGLVKTALKILVDRMRTEDRIAIVTYASSARLALESTTVSQRQRILNVIDSLYAGGNTNGSGGIQLAYQVAQANFRRGGVNRVILTTDGDFNVGVTSREALLQLIADQRQSGISLTSIGVGSGDLNEATLEQLADKGDGNYFYLDSLKEARKVMEEQIASTIEVVAKDVKLQLEFNPSYVREYRLIGYDNRTLANHEFKNDTVDAGEVGAGHSVTVLYELLLNDRAAMDERLRYQGEPEPTVVKSSAFPDELAFLKVRYKEPESATSQELRFPLLKSQVRADPSQASEDFRFAAAVGYFAQLLKRSRFVSGYGYNDVIRLAESARGADLMGQRREFIDLAKDAALLSGRSSFQE